MTRGELGNLLLSDPNRLDEKVLFYDMEWEFTENFNIGDVEVGVIENGRCDYDGNKLPLYSFWDDNFKGKMQKEKVTLIMFG